MCVKKLPRILIGILGLDRLFFPEGFYVKKLPYCWCPFDAFVNDLTDSEGVSTPSWGNEDLGN